MGKIGNGKKRNADEGERERRQPVRAQPAYSTNSFQEQRSGVPGSVRLLGVLCFLVPVVAAIPYGMQLFAQSSFLREVLLKPLFPLVRAFHTSRYANFFCIIGLYGLVAKNRSMHPLLQQAGMQASTLLMVQFPANFLLQFFGAGPGPIANLARASIFAYMMCCAFLGAFGSLQGRSRLLPGIGNGLPTLRRPPGGMTSFRGGG